MNRIAIILISIAFFTSCDNVKKEFSEKERNVIDSIYRIKKKKLKIKLDSLCDSVYKTDYPILIDSIKKIRKEEILDLIEK